MRLNQYEHNVYPKR